jgi:hypothetical protein
MRMPDTTLSFYRSSEIPRERFRALSPLDQTYYHVTRLDDGSWSAEHILSGRVGDRAYASKDEACRACLEFERRRSARA